MERSVEFDGPGFAHQLVVGRRRLALTTRDLARLAGISQAYVVALERPAGYTGRAGPTPTIDVVGRLAHALGVEVVDLVAAALRPPAGRHVLLVADGTSDSPVQLVRRCITAPVDKWLCAAPASRSRAVQPGDATPIRLHRHRRRIYDPRRVAASLTSELERVDTAGAAKLAGQRLGFVFTEMSGLLANVDDPMNVIGFEEHWANTVADASASVGACVDWNICVYAADDLLALADPVESLRRLVRTHDAVWATFENEVVSGTSAGHRIATRLGRHLHS
jgi:transcriptional regulator with XRE-family HTH domain